MEELHKFLATIWEWIHESTFYFVGIALMLAGFFCLYYDKPTHISLGFIIVGCLFSLGGYLIKRRHDLQVIAWAGYEEESIYRNFKGRLSFLLYRRGPVRLARFKYLDDLGEKGSEFDVLVSDLELIARHHATERLEDLSALRELLHGVAGVVAKRMRPEAMLGGNVLGIPIRFGFNEILVRPDKVPDGLKDGAHSLLNGSSYVDFALDKLIAHTTSENRIGLYSGYLPTLSILLLTQGEHLAEVEKQDIAKLKPVIEMIRCNHEKFHFLETAEDVREQFKDGSIWIALGAGSWVINTSVAKNIIQILLPEEGVLMWTECGTVLGNVDAPRANAHQLIKHWLQKETQKALSNGTVYGACPVVCEVLTEVLGSHPSTPTLQKWLDSTSGQWNSKDDSKVHHRKLPENWRDWEKAWENVEKAIRGD